MRIILAAAMKNNSRRTLPYFFTHRIYRSSALHISEVKPKPPITEFEIKNMMRWKNDGGQTNGKDAQLRSTVDSDIKKGF